MININIVNKWKRSPILADKIRAKLLISNAGLLAINKSLLENPGLTLNKLKTNLKSVVLLYCGVFDQLIPGFAFIYL